ncbi:MAG: isoprenylcysteine carboxylmethyltransferase family protein [Candidatus Heimdallarchaeota archaeon]|nr:MAG: isoprenylcysteine carboxylmethyltransferase family protein [Candidatus Heimdallarchaeota archaeon]
MSVWFWISILGEIVILPVYFWSLEHTRLQQKFGLEKGTKIGDILGLISGWGFFLFLFGIWLSPQPRFILLILQDVVLVVPIMNFTIPLAHLIIFVPIIIIVLWISLKGVSEVTLKVAETHRAEKVITTGVYSIVRHPQYLGAVLAHLGISILLSALYSLLLTPLLMIYIYLISWKEEKELVKEFGKDYEEYKAQVPMFIPRIKLR